MRQKNIERNQLDYILTDVLPTELSEQFSYLRFYEYLDTKSSEIGRIIKNLIKKKNENKEVFKESINWRTVPLTYTIMKRLRTERTISLLQPLAAMQLFLFVSVYQKELLTILQKNSVFSLRYHRRNNDLYYKSKNKSVTKYFEDISGDTGKDVIEQTGMYFKIGPYKSISAFTSSEDWLVLNSKYNFFVRTDYKSCFDSIYTHTFNWIIGKDVNDTIKFSNGSIFSAIDRVLMNVNASTSNGIVVGPEFSRMVAEILLQTIDRDVFSMLLNNGVVLNEDYNIYRFVDDIFIFADSEELADKIVDYYSEASRKYLLQLNESKQYKNTVPFVLDSWFTETNLFTNRAASLLFYSKEEQDAIIKEYKNAENNSDNEIFVPHLLKGASLSITKKTIMNQFNELICKYESKDKTIVSYFLGMILNKTGRSKDSVKIFKRGISDAAVFNFLELAFYTYSFFPDYNNTQKLLSIVSYVRDEFDIFQYREKLQRLIKRYAFVFEKANLSDIVNLILFCCQAKIEIPYRQEAKIVERLCSKDDPILWASYLLYSRYSKKYYLEIRNKIGNLLVNRIKSIVQKESMYTYREFWWVIVFNKSPHLNVKEQSEIDSLLSTAKSGGGDSCPELGKIFIDFLKNSPEQFFEWDIEKKDFLRIITFKTRQRSIFKNYQENLQSLYWSSI